MKDARGIELKEGDSVLAHVDAYAPRERTIHSIDEELKVAFWYNIKTGRLNRMHQDVIYKVPKRDE